MIEDRSSYHSYHRLKDYDIIDSIYHQHDEDESITAVTQNDIGYFVSQARCIKKLNRQSISLSAVA